MTENTSEMKFNAKQQEAIDMVLNEQRNIFLTGAGGTGKSEVIKHVKKELEALGRIVAVTSMTGVSALLIGGLTLHSWAGIGLGNARKDVLCNQVMRCHKDKNWKSVDLLIIDEISIMSPELLEKIDFIGRRMRNRMRPFGGIQLLFSGDFAQLPPVGADLYCFESDVWKSCDFYVCYLKENMRQSNSKFQELLARARLGELSKDDERVLSNRNKARPPSDAEIKPTKLFSTRAQVDNSNETELNVLIKVLGRKAHEHVSNDKFKLKEGKEFTSKQKQNFLETAEKNCPARKRLVLAVGAQVMLVSNLNLLGGLCNGSRGVVKRYNSSGLPIVLFMNGTETALQQATFEIKVSDDAVVIRKQIPLVLAYASTIHKCQGATLDCVQVSLGNDIFSCGQSYVALSRVRTLEGLYISSLCLSKIACDPKVKKFYSSLD
jgi:ATP-dependent DNA helicase PIF1